MTKTKAYSEVAAKLGSASSAFEKLSAHIRFYYELDEDWQEGNPTHKHHSTLRFRRGGKTLITLGLREGYFLAAIVMGKDERAKFEEQRKDFGEAICREYDLAEVLHDGKWLGFEIHNEELIEDIIKLLPIKLKPNRKVLPKNLESCGKLEIGLLHTEITKILIV